MTPIMGIVAASILAADFARLGEQVAAVEPHVGVFHVDIMDGHFVPPIALGTVIVQSLRPVTTRTLHGHLMVDAPEPMVDLFVRDITVGMAGTGVKAGMLKCAIEAAGLRPGVERTMRAVAQAHVATGTPITVHTVPKEHTGIEVQRVLAEEGADLSRVVIGHCGDTGDLDYLMRLADKGSLLGMDRFGIDFTPTTQARVDTISEMVRRGYGDRMALSHDCCIGWSDYFPRFDDYRRVMPNHHLHHIHDDVLPMLREAGVTDAQIEAMFVDNPRRLFGG